MNYGPDNNNNNQKELVNITAEEKKEAESKKRKSGRLAAVLSLLTVAVFAAAAMTIFSFIGKKADVETSAKEDAVPTGANIIRSDGNEEMRGVWIASTFNINYPSKPGLSESEMKEEIDEIVENVKKANLNAIFFQVRPAADALYPSEIFPYSKYLTGTQGESPDNDFDSLAYIIDKASENGIEVHAWVNPYRITTEPSDEGELCDSSPAVLHPEYTVKYADGKTYFNPGLPEVRQLVIDGVREIAENYPNISGIHFDDYFYPYPSGGAEFDDEAAYAVYGGGMDKADWRRENVNALVKGAYDAVKEVNPNIRFGVSPFGIWANAGSDTPVNGSVSSGFEAYSSLYCDALAWADGGYVDYLIPQIYWSFSTSSAPFDNIARWWNAALDGTGVDLYIGHAAFKAADYPDNEMGIQVEFARNLISYRGSVYCGYEDIKNNTCGLMDKIASLNEEPVTYSYDGLSDTASVLTPANNYQSSSSTVSLVGSSDVNYPLTVNGEKISRTKSGLFSYYTTVDAGINVFTLEQNGVRTTHNINYKTTKNDAPSASSSNNLGAMKITDVVPSGEAWLMKGDTLKISCIAPGGSEVVAKIGGMSVVLKPTLNTVSNLKYVREIYSGEITPSNFAGDGEIVPLGTLKITATLGEESVTSQGGLIKQMGEKALVYAEITKDYTRLRLSPSSSFYDEYTPASPGLCDYVKGLYGSYYKLSFGAYVSAENVKIVEGIELNQNKVLDVKVAVNGMDTINNKNNFTDVTFRCLENVPANAVASDDVINITFYNTDSSLIPLPEVEANPIVSYVKAVAIDDTTLRYTVVLKDKLNMYGYNVIYENGNIILRLNNPQSLSSDPEKPLAGKTIVVDAGHGGNDSGALGCGNVNEAALNLEEALYLQKELEALGANVIMSRTEDVTFVLEDRTVFLAEINPDMAISIHQNSVASSANAQKARGFLGLYCAESGKLLAKTVSSTVSEQLNRYERPYSYQMLAVARNHRFPSALCEMCFISNIEEYEWSITPGNTERSAKALADGILNYYKAQEAYLAY